MRNVLVYDTSCSTGVGGGGGGSGLPLEIVAFLAHSHPTNHIFLCNISSDIRHYTFICNIGLNILHFRC